MTLYVYPQSVSNQFANAIRVSALVRESKPARSSIFDRLVRHLSVKNSYKKPNFERKPTLDLARSKGFRTLQISVVPGPDRYLRTATSYRALGAVSIRSLLYSKHVLLRVFFMSGWICLHRDIVDHWVFQDADKFRAWIDLLMMANWEPKDWCDGFEIIAIARGSFITSQVQLAERWGKSRDWVQRYLKMLMAAEMIAVKSGTRYTHITILNYSRYQDESERNRHQNGSGAASERHQSGSGAAQLNNITNKQDPLSDRARASEGVIDSDGDRCPLTQDEYNELATQFLSYEAVDTYLPIIEAHLRAQGLPRPKSPVDYVRKWMLKDRTERTGFFRAPPVDLGSLENAAPRAAQSRESAAQRNLRTSLESAMEILAGCNDEA